jgi:hypothetical protein
VHEDGINVASCITFVRSRNADEVLLRFGGDPATARLMTLTEVAEENCNSGDPCDYAPLLLVDTINDWVMIFEDNGFQATRHEVLQAVSLGTEMVSVYWNVNARQQFIYALDGKTVTEFKLQSPESRRGTEPDRLLDYMKGLPFESGNTLASALALAERITGIRVDRSWFKVERRVVQVTPLPQEPDPDLKPEESSLALYHPEIAPLIIGAPAIAWRRIAILAAERSAAETGIDSDQVIRVALQTLRSGASDSFDFDASRSNLTPFLQMLGRAYHNVPRPTIIASMEGDRSILIDTGQEERLMASRRLSAGYAVRNALLPDPLMSALHSVYEASLAVSDKDSFFQEVISLIG